MLSNPSIPVKHVSHDAAPLTPEESKAADDLFYGKMKAFAGIYAAALGELLLYIEQVGRFAHALCACPEQYGGRNITDLAAALDLPLPVMHEWMEFVATRSPARIQEIAQWPLTEAMFEKSLPKTRRRCLASTVEA